MMINPSNSYYQKNKEKLQKMARERYQKLTEEEKEKSINMVVEGIKIFLEIEKRLCIGKSL